MRIIIGLSNLSMNTTEIKVVETTNGQIEADTLSSRYKLCLSHEILAPAVSALQAGRPLTLQNYHHHVSNPLSLENGSLTPGLLEHELQKIVQTGKCNHSQILIMDGSNYAAKVSELFDKYTVVKGYSYKLEGNIYENEKLGLLKPDHVFKQIQYEFKFGNGKYKPGFIGEIALKDCLPQSPYYTAFQSYLKFSAITSCPIVINTNQIGQATVETSFSANHPRSKEIAERYNEIESVLSLSKAQKVSKIVLYNLPLLLVTSFNQQTFEQSTTNITTEKIIQLLRSYEFTLGFDLTRYNTSKEGLNFIALLMKAFPERIILSGGARFKTDLSAFGGEGYLFYLQDSNFASSLVRIATIVGDDSIIEKATFLNKLSILNWKIRVQEVKLVLMWKCSHCSGDQPQTVESFRKFGKQFCSIKCLKSYKF